MMAQLPPQEIQIRFTQAVEAYQQGAVLVALRHTEELIRHGASFQGLRCLEAACLAGLGRMDEAQAALNLELTYPTRHDQVPAVQKLIDEARSAEKQRSDKPRDWSTSLSGENFQSIQRELHHYEYKSVPLLKSPFDLALYQLLLWKLKPRTIFEIGSFSGGSALWMGDLLNNYQIDGKIFSVDIVAVTSLMHPRVEFLSGNGQEPASVFPPQLLASAPRPWLVIEDADHTFQTTHAVLEYFHPQMQSGDYFVVEDGISCQGVRDALDDFIADHGNDYEVDPRYCDFYGYNMTWNLNGFLRRR